MNINGSDLAPKDKQVVVPGCKAHIKTYLDHTSPADIKKYTSNHEKLKNISGTIHAQQNHDLFMKYFMSISRLLNKCAIFMNKSSSAYGIFLVLFKNIS